MITIIAYLYDIIGYWEQEVGLAFVMVLGVMGCSCIKSMP